MSIYRGAGGASDATDDSTVNAVAGYASAAASSASSAATSATNASNSATDAASSASSAASSAASVATNATNAATSAGLANTYATAANNSKEDAAASASIASTKAGEASSSASNAATSASNASTSASSAATSASSAASIVGSGNGTFGSTPITTSSTITINSGTANGVAYLNGSKVLSSGSALTFDGTNLGVGTSSPSGKLDVVASNAGGTTYNYFQNNGASGVSLVGLAFAQSNAIKSSITAAVYGNDYMAFNVGSNTERARIDSSGNLLVGTTTTGGTPTQGLGVNVNGGTTYFAVGHITGSISGAAYASFAYNGGQIGSITQSGTTAVLYNTSSDQRLKENIADAAPASELIDAIQVRQFDWKSDGSHQRYGFVAQELVAVAPEAVHQPADPEDMMAVDYSKLVPMLVKEIQSLRARVAQLEAKGA